MKFHEATFLRRLLKETRGQTMFIGAAALSAIIGLSGVAIDFSHGYYALEQLQASTNAAAMAGAFAMPNTTHSSHQYYELQLKGERLQRQLAAEQRCCDANLPVPELHGEAGTGLRRFHRLDEREFQRYPCGSDSQRPDMVRKHVRPDQLQIDGSFHRGL